MTTQDLTHLEQTVASAGTHLTTVQTKLSEVEKSLANPGEEIDDVCVMELLESMTEVKNEYQNLRKDLKEVQQLQKEMTNTLRCMYIRKLALMNNSLMKQKKW
ncbi:uncharacterized protein LOC119655059 isoform X2 [Hermetia illucens]|uniref:uncharacterized protein LOC119655059 isoform X2 n=1 Tax=Hermetia illucens TaxID=343691 RepID=UPI0018CC5CFD|nr:uncharacterized protein LOC119655059 isoform X2 [Hermetia illucens]